MRGLHYLCPVRSQAEREACVSAIAAWMSLNPFSRPDKHHAAGGCFAVYQRFAAGIRSSTPIAQLIAH